MAGKVELADHEVVEQSDDIGAGADQVAIVGERLLEGAGAAELIAALEHEDFASGSRQVSGCREAVVAAADDDRVPFARRQLGDRGGQADPSQLRVDVDSGHRVEG